MSLHRQAEYCPTCGSYQQHVSVVTYCKYMYRIPCWCVPNILRCGWKNDGKTEYGWGNLLVRLKAPDEVGCYVNNTRGRAFRRVGSTRLDFSPFNTFKVSYEDIVIFEDKQFELAQSAAQHYQITWSEVKPKTGLIRFYSQIVKLSLGRPKGHPLSSQRNIL
jgi:hypothetical protein